MNIGVYILYTVNILVIFISVLRFIYSSQQYKGDICKGTFSLPRALEGSHAALMAEQCQHISEQSTGKTSCVEFFS